MQKALTEMNIQLANAMELLGDLMNRGLDFAELRLYVLDGGKALHAAVKKYAGESAPIQRCHPAGPTRPAQTTSKTSR